jgi:hypothetical protein
MLRKGTHSAHVHRNDSTPSSLEQRSAGNHRISEQGNVRHTGSTRTGSGTTVIHCTLRLRYFYNSRWVNVSLRRALRSCHDRQKEEKEVGAEAG